jgi:Sigma-54 interaction domain
MPQQILDGHQRRIDIKQLFSHGEQQLMTASTWMPDAMNSLPGSQSGKLGGALVIACSGECVCNRKGLDVIDLIFRQTAGTIRRAALQEEEIRDLQERVQSSAEFSGIIGKELVAKAIHHLNPRRDRPLSSSTVRPTRPLLESELFGHNKGVLLDASGPTIV